MKSETALYFAKLAMARIRISKKMDAKHKTWPHWDLRIAQRTKLSKPPAARAHAALEDVYQNDLGPRDMYLGQGDFYHEIHHKGEHIGTAVLAHAGEPRAGYSRSGGHFSPTFLAPGMESSGRPLQQSPGYQRLSPVQKLRFKEALKSKFRPILQEGMDDYDRKMALRKKRTKGEE